MLTDDNPPAAGHLRTDGSWINTLVDIIRWGAKTDEESATAKGKGKAAEGDMAGVEGDAVDEHKSDLLLRVLAAGTIRHIMPLPPLLPVAALDLEKTLIIPLLDSLLDVNLPQVSEEALRLASDLPDAATIAAQLKDPKTDHKTTSERGLDQLENRLTTLQIGLEVLLDICSKVPDAKDDDDEEEMADGEGMAEDGDDDMMDEDAEEIDEEELIALGRDQPAEEAAAASGDALPLPSTLVNLLSTLNLPGRLLALATPTQLSFLPLTSNSPPSSSPSPHPPTTALLSTIHLRALEALNNLFISIAFFLPSATSPTSKSAEWVAFFAHTRSSLQPIWDGLFSISGTVAPSAEVLSVKGQEVRLELLDMALGGLMGVAGLTRGALRLERGEVGALIAACQGSTRESIRGRAIGCLSSLAARDVDVGPEHIETNKTIGTFLITVLTSSDLTAETMVAVLNGLFDVYADETSAWDVPVFRQGRFLAALKTSVGKARGVTRSVDKRKNAELRARADEAFENLTAFIKYRRSVE